MTTQDDRKRDRWSNRRLTEKEIAEIAREPSKYETLRQAVLDYLSEIDNPVPDPVHRHTLRNHLRKLTDAPAEPPPRKR